MSEALHAINRFKDYASWLGTLKEMDNDLWVTPIRPGKWSVSEIICHIMKWDRHLLTDVIPSVKNGYGMRFPDFDTFNKKASVYANSGISQLDLLDEAIITRKLLVNELHKVSDARFSKHLTANNETHCPHTGEPYSLLYIIKEFIDHDEHHKAQVIEFLHAEKLV